jgi:type II secretory pathway pseudopilin PulG
VKEDYITRSFKGLFRRGEQGISLLESIIAIAILGGAVITLVVTMSGGALAVSENDRQAVAQGLARTQLEYVKNCVFDPGATTYPTVSVPEGYSVSVGVTAVPGAGADIQKITANVTRDGAVILSAEDYKVNR